MSVKKIITKPLSSIKNVSFNHNDTSLYFSNQYFTTTDGLTFTLYDALKNLNDFSINNYSCLFMGKKQPYSDWLCSNNETIIMTNYASSITFLNDNITFDTNLVDVTPGLKLVWDTSASLTDQKQTLLLEHIQDDLYYVKFINNNIPFYLFNRRYDSRINDFTGGPVDDLHFTSDQALAQQFGQFSLIKNENSIMLFLIKNNAVRIKFNDDTTLWVDYEKNLKYISTNNYEIIRPLEEPEKSYYYVADEYIGENVSIVEQIRIRSIASDGDNLILIDNKQLLPVITNNGTTFTSIANISTTNLTLPSFVQSNWIAYNNLHEINHQKSAFEQDGQCLFSFQYNNIENSTTQLDVIPVKTNVSPNNNIIRGYSLDANNNFKPNVGFREYTTLETGANQEFGNNTISLTYTFYDNEILIKPGTDNYFTTSPNNLDLPNELQSSLYPFNHININDTQFVKNGAFGSNIPFIADKIKKLQSNSNFVNNGQYLYTWLYRTHDTAYGIWLDRYYYPNIEQKQNSLLNVHFKPASFLDIIDKSYIQVDDEFKNAVTNVNYFDKQSDLVIEPDTQYVYSRTGQDEFNTIFNDISSNLVNTLTEYNSDVHEPVNINIDKIKESGQLDLSFEMFLSPNSSYGHTILSNTLNTGLSITNNTNISPFIYTFTNSTEASVITLYNQNYDIIKQLNLTNLYNDLKINRLIFDKPFNDIYVLTDEYIYILSYDIIPKKRFKINDVMPYIENIVDIFVSDNILYILTSYYKNLIKYQDIFKFDYVSETVTQLFRFDDKLLPFIKQDGGPTIYGLYDEINVTKLNADTYEAIDNDFYPLPYGISNGDILLLSPESVDSIVYYAPLFNLDDNTLNQTVILNSIYFDGSYVYGLPHTLIANNALNQSEYLYGINGGEDNTLSFVEEINLSNYRSSYISTGNKNAIYGAYNPIINISVNSLNQMLILHYESDKTLEEAKLMLSLFDKNKQIIKQIPIGQTYSNILGIDNIRVINADGITDKFIVIASTYNTNTELDEYFALYVDSVGNLSDPLSIAAISNSTKFLNFNKVIENYQNNILAITLSLPSDGLSTYQLNYQINLSTILPQFYQFRIIIDLTNGIFDLYINGVKQMLFSGVINSNYIYNNKNTFSYPLTIGTMNYKIGIPLYEFLKLPSDYYQADNILIKNLALFNKILSYSEVQSFILKDQILNDMIITLPGGQQNKAEEIIRYFKYNPPGNMSNQIDINIKNAGITNVSEQKQLIDEILVKINEELACPITINNINFI